MPSSSVQRAPASPEQAIRAAGRIGRRMAADAHVLLAVGVATPTILVELVGPGVHALAVVVAAIAYVAVQAIIVPLRDLIHPRDARGIPDALTSRLARLCYALLFVTLARQTSADGAGALLAPLYIPVVSLAAAAGRGEAITIGTLALIGYLGPVILSRNYFTSGAQEAFVLASASTVLAIATRRTVASLEHTLRRLRHAAANSRRRNRQMAAVEAVGRTLAMHGPDTEALDQIMDLVHRRLGYSNVSIYLGNDRRLRLGAQRGYSELIEAFDGTRGIIGRTMRLRTAQIVPNPAIDPDYVGTASGILGEICVPLMSGDEMLGVVNVETDVAPLDDSDHELVLLVADRLAAALALARERRSLADRADLFQRLIGFSVDVTASLDGETLHRTIAGGVGRVIPSLSAILTVLDRRTGRYRIEAIEGGSDRPPIGAEIRPGQGMAGRAIRDRAVVSEDAYRYHVGSKATRRNTDAGAPIVRAVAVPLVRDAVVVGALTLVRRADDEPFTALELEALQVVAAQTALAVANTFLHSDVTEASIRDPLTGLYNRRHLDASLGRMMAARARRTPEERVPTSAIMFDLDHFGDFNKRHGHQVGDTVLRGFGELLRDRFRASDLVARYGGEEFLVILEGAALQDAYRIAEEVRHAWSQRIFPGADGSALHASVSAGCAALDVNSTSFDELVATADVGLVMAKHAGRNQVVAA